MGNYHIPLSYMPFLKNKRMKNRSAQSTQNSATPVPAETVPYFSKPQSLLPHERCPLSYLDN